MMLFDDLLLKDELKKEIKDVNIIYTGENPYLTKGKMYQGTLSEDGTFTLLDDTNLEVVITKAEYVEYVPNNKKEKLVPLNFRVTEDFRREFKLFALENNMNGHELFFEMYKLFRLHSEGRL